MFAWLSDSYQWIFSGIGVVLLSYLIKFLLSRNEIKGAVGDGTVINIKNNFSERSAEVLVQKEGTKEFEPRTLDEYKDSTRILFIDDDVKFKVTKILQKSGWIHTKLIKDCESIDDPDVQKADILFIDVQGVGAALGFRDEGLGLSLAIKEKYPSKKIIIYSAETNGERFHEALRKADSSLPKNADPYEFQRIVESFTVGQAEK